jgi:hypothetical protein
VGSSFATAVSSSFAMMAAAEWIEGAGANLDEMRAIDLND